MTEQDRIGQDLLLVVGDFEGGPLAGGRRPALSLAADIAFQLQRDSRAKAFEFLALAFSFQFDAAVGQVAYATRDVELSGQTSHGGPETYTLNVSCKPDRQSLHSAIPNCY